MPTPDKTQVCWLCGNHLDIWESGLCAKDYEWAEANTPSGATENEIRRLYSEYTANELPRMIADLMDKLGIERYP